MGYGVQIFGCLKEFRQDPAGFFQRLGQMGYRQVEPCILFGGGEGVPPELRERLWKPAEVPGFLRMMEGCGLALSSCHVFDSDPLACADGLLRLAEEVPVSAYVVNCGADIASGYPAFAEDCARLSTSLSQKGVELWIHNLGTEIRERVVENGRELTVLEALLARCPERVGVQVDTGWVLYGGIDPTEFLRRVAPRLRSVHFKDMAAGFERLSGDDIFAVLGKGVTDCEAVFSAIPQGRGVTVLVDQDMSRGDFFADLEQSLHVLQEFGEKEGRPSHPNSQMDGNSGLYVTEQTSLMRGRLRSKLPVTSQQSEEVTRVRCACRKPTFSATEAERVLKCAIFDADGTLIDSMPMWRDLDYEFAALKGIPMTPESHAALNRLSLEQGAVYYRDVLGVPGTAEEICAEVEALSHEGYRRKVRPKPGAAELLRRLHENGVGIAVATASSAVGVRGCLEENGLAGFVDFFITCGDVGKSKEFPDIFLRCAEEFGASPGESVVFEDSLHAVRTAQSAGFPVVAVKDGGNGDEAELRRTADRFLDSFEELLGEIADAE